VAKTKNSLSLIFLPHGAGSVTARLLLLSSDGQMVLVFQAQLVEFGHRDHHKVLQRPLGTDPPLEGTAGLAHSLAGKDDVRVMFKKKNTTQDYFFLSVGECTHIQIISVYLTREE